MPYRLTFADGSGEDVAENMRPPGSHWPDQCATDSCAAPHIVSVEWVEPKTEPCWRRIWSDGEVTVTGHPPRRDTWLAAPDDDLYVVSCERVEAES